MNPQRILGLLILIGGVVLLVVGINASHSMADQVSNTFRGRFTDGTTWYIIGGVVTGLFGLSMALMCGRGKNT